VVKPLPVDRRRTLGLPAGDLRHGRAEGVSGDRPPSPWSRGQL